MTSIPGDRLGCRSNKVTVNGGCSQAQDSKGLPETVGQDLRQLSVGFGAGLPNEEGMVTPENWK